MFTKLNDQQLQTKHYEDLITKHQKHVDDLRRKQAKFPDRCYDEQIQYHIERQRYYYRKTQDPLAICEDFKISPAVNIEMVNFYLNNLFPNDNAYVSIMVNDGCNIKRRMMDIEKAKRKMPHILSLEMNTYISPCNFAHRRTIKTEGGEEEVLKGSCKELVIETSAMIIDLDYRTTEFSGLLAQDFYDLIRDSGAFQTVGKPSFVVVSSEGRGVQLVYLLDKPYKTKFDNKRITRFEATTRRLIKHFEEWGADFICCDLGRVYRLPCSINTKTGTFSYILDWDNLRDDDTEILRYSFEKLEKNSLQVQPEPEPEPEPTKVLEPEPTTVNKPNKPVKRKLEPKQKQTAKDTSRNNIKTVALNRCKDLKRIIELRNYDVEGYRNSLLFIYGAVLIGLCDNKETILNELLSINETFLSPLPDKEVENIIKSITKKSYAFTDKYICDLLDITMDEIKSMKALGHNLTEEEIKARNRERQRLLRLKKGHVPKEARAARNTEIRKLHEDGLSTKKLAERFNLNIRSVQRICKESPQK